MKNKSPIILAVVLAVLVVIALVTKQSWQRSSPTEKELGCSLNGVVSGSSVKYCVKSVAEAASYAANTPTGYSFSILDSRGNTVKNFAVTHTKLMHVIVVRKDLQYFQHIHPEFHQETGVFTLADLNFPADGHYRLFADFALQDGPVDTMGRAASVTPWVDLTVGSKYARESIGTTELSKDFDGNRVTLSTDMPLQSGKESTLSFDLKQHGRPITDLEDYLGALGHSVILREGTLSFIHAHPIEDSSKPQSGTVHFMVDFPQAGNYKIFTQFQRSGKVFTTDFVVTVTSPASSIHILPKPHSEHIVQPQK